MRPAVTFMTTLSHYPWNQGFAVKLLCSVVVFLTVTRKVCLTFNKSVCMTKNCFTWVHKQDANCSTSRVFTHKFKLQVTFTAVQHKKNVKSGLPAPKICTRPIQLLPPSRKLQVMQKKCNIQGRMVSVRLLSCIRQANYSNKTEWVKVL